MTTETHNAIMRYVEQFISNRDTTFGLQIAIMADDRETIDAVTTIARAAGNRVKKIVVAKGEPEAEMHLTIN